MGRSPIFGTALSAETWGGRSPTTAERRDFPWTVRRVPCSTFGSMPPTGSAKMNPSLSMWRTIKPISSAWASSSTVGASGPASWKHSKVPRASVACRENDPAFRMWSCRAVSRPDMQSHPQSEASNSYMVSPTHRIAAYIWFLERGNIPGKRK